MRKKGGLRTKMGGEITYKGSKELRRRVLSRINQKFCIRTEISTEYLVKMPKRLSRVSTSM